MGPVAHLHLSIDASRAAVRAMAMLVVGCGGPQESSPVVTGGTGGVYYPLDGGLDNVQLVASGRATVGFSVVDAV